MGRLVPILVSVVWLTAAGCDDRDTSRSARGRATPTPIELVTAWAGPGIRVAPISARVPGYEVFQLSSDGNQGPPTQFGVAVPVDEQNFLEGQGGLRTLIEAGIPNASTLARLTMLFLERGGEPLLEPRTEIHREHGVTPPLLVHGELTYWYERGSWSYIELLRSRLDLATVTLSTESVHVTEHRRDDLPEGHP